jgi:hypothetical protein
MTKVVVPEAMAVVPHKTVSYMLDVMVRRIKFHEEMSKLAGSTTGMKREKTRVHALSEALGEMRNVLKETNK